MPDSIFRSTPTAAETTELATSTVITRLQTGAAGTRRLQQHYGKDLVCVRYRESADGSARYTTVEIVVERRAVRKRQPANAEQLVRINFGESELREKVKAAGGRCDPKLKLWRLPAAVQALRLKNRVVEPIH